MLLEAVMELEAEAPEAEAALDEPRSIVVAPVRGIEVDSVVPPMTLEAVLELSTVDDEAETAAVELVELVGTVEFTLVDGVPDAMVEDTRVVPSSVLLDVVDSTLADGVARLEDAWETVVPSVSGIETEYVEPPNTPLELELTDGLPLTEALTLLNVSERLDELVATVEAVDLFSVVLSETLADAETVELNIELMLAADELIVPFALFDTTPELMGTVAEAVELLPVDVNVKDALTEAGTLELDAELTAPADTLIVPLALVTTKPELAEVSSE